MGQDSNRKSNVWWMSLLFAVTLALGLGAAVYVYLPALLPQQTTEIVVIAGEVIAGETGPFKSKPENPGGKIITNQDSTVMKMLGNLTPEAQTTETLLPPSEGPELPPTTVPAPDTPPETAIVTDPAQPQDDGSKKQTADESSDPALSDNSAAPAVDAKPEKPQKTIVATPKQTAETKQTDAEKPTAKGSDEPTYMVQLAAFRKPDIAAEQTGLLLKKHETRLQGATLGTMRIDTGDNGIFWRVVTEPLPRVVADTVCAALKRAGQDCILRKHTQKSQ